MNNHRPSTKGTNQNHLLVALALQSGSPSLPMRIRGDAPTTIRSTCFCRRPKELSENHSTSSMLLVGSQAHAHSGDSLLRNPTIRSTWLSNAPKGFSLVEILVAVLLLAMLGIIVSVSTSSLIGSIRDTRQLQEYYHTARVALSRVEREVAMAYLSKHQSERRTTKTVFLGKTNSLTFTTTGHRRMVSGAKESDESVVEFKVERDSKTGDNVLIRREKTVIDDQPYKGGRKRSWRAASRS